jgi:hypothetical protein
MDLVIRNPGVLFLSKQQVAGQLEAMQQLLQLPSLQPLLEEEVAVSQQLLADAHHMQQQLHEAAVGAAGAGSSNSSQGMLPAADHQWLMDEQAQLQEQREQQVQQLRKALKAWRKAAHQQNAAAAAAAGSGGSGGELPWEHWPGRLVCHAPQWLFVDPHVTMPRRVDYLARLLFGSSVIKANSSSGGGGSSSSSVSTVRKVSALLLDAPQLIGVNPPSVPGKLRTLQKVLQQHPGFALQQRQRLEEVARQTSTTAKPRATTKGKPGKQQQLQDAADVVPLLLQSPLLLVQPAKQLQQYGSDLLQRLPRLPLYHLLLLLPQQQLHWQQLEFLQHLQLLPAAGTATMNEAPSEAVQTPAGAAALTAAHHHSSSNSSSRSSSPQQAAVQPDAWTDAHLQLVTEALSSQPLQFTARYPQYPAWQAAAAAAQASARDWRAGWGWQQELQQQLAGPACQAWLLQLNGKWQRLLLLAAGERWLQAQPAAAAAAGVVVQAGSKKKRRSRATSSRLGPSTAAAVVRQGIGLQGGVSLRQVAELTSGEFSFRPAAAAGPIPWDLPQSTIQQLLCSSKAALDNELDRLSRLWQQLVAVAEDPAALQQLADAAGMLPQAVLAAGWKLPAGVSKALTSSSSEGGITSSWIEECMEARAGVGSQAAAAAAALAARQQFWQYVQQPGVLTQLCSRLQYIHQTGIAKQQQQLASSSSSSGSVDLRKVWSVLAVSDAAFTATCPEFATWQQLHAIVSDKQGWADELAALRGQQLLTWLQQAAASWWRLAYLASDVGGDGSVVWQAISMSDALAASDEAFMDMFPEARYGSWQVLAQLRGDEDATSSNSSSSSTASGSPQGPRGLPASSSVSQAGPAAVHPYGSSSSSAGGGSAAQRSPKPKADLAAQRLQLLQDYASLHPAWEAELRGWKKEAWSIAARTFVPLRARRLEFILQVLEAPGSEAGSSCSEVGSGGDTAATGSCVEEQPDAAAAAAVQRVPDLQHLVTAANVHFLRKFPLFTVWHEVGSAVQAVPRWSAEWHAVRGAALVQLLQQVQQLQAPDAAAARQQAFEQHLELLRGKLAEKQLQQGDESLSVDVLQLPVVGKSSLRSFSLTRVGVTSLPSSSSSSSSLATQDDDAADAAAGAGYGGKKKVQLAVQAAQRSSRRQQQQQRHLQGLELALQRLAYFSSGVRAANAVRDLPLQQLLVMPQLQLLDISPAFDPALTAAKAQGCADAESQFLEEVYPWLGFKALSPEVQQGLSPKGVRLLEERLGDLMLLQQVAHTWPAWEQQLRGYGPGKLELLVRRMPARSERLQVMVRCGWRQLLLRVVCIATAF